MVKERLLRELVGEAVGAATTSVKQSRTSATVVFLVETVELVARVPMASALVAPRRSAERGGVAGVRRARFTAPASSRRVQRPRRVRRPLGERLRAAGAARADRGRRGRRSGHVPAQGRARPALPFHYTTSLTMHTALRALTPLPLGRFPRVD